MDTQTLRDTLTRMIASDEDTMRAMREDKPTVTDSHSDGKRVRYARTEERARVMADILALLEA